MEQELTCEMCVRADTSVGVSTGFNGEEARVCDRCDTDGSDYNGWGGYYEEEQTPSTTEYCVFTGHKNYSSEGTYFETPEGKKWVCKKFLEIILTKEYERLIK